jgi:hypothetical protein
MAAPMIGAVDEDSGYALASHLAEGDFLRSFHPASLADRRGAGESLARIADAPICMHPEKALYSPLSRAPRPDNPSDDPTHRRSSLIIARALAVETILAACVCVVYSIGIFRVDLAA